jgi:serine/threonine-protein kinase RsbW
LRLRPLFGRALRTEAEDHVEERPDTGGSALQQSILPSELPSAPGVELAARYQAGAAGLEVGGDWFDAFYTTHGALGLVIGDVVGKGIQASTTMARLRFMIRAFMLVGAQPEDLLSRLDTLPAEETSGEFATSLVATLHPATGLLTYACAGHPPPLRVRAHGASEYLWGGRSAPLCPVHANRTQAAAHLADGDLLLLYTDGLIERRGSTIDHGMDALRQAASDAAGQEIPTIIDAIFERLSAHQSNDDIAILAARFTHDP